MSTQTEINPLDWTRLVWKYARAYQRSAKGLFELDDLFQIGFVGLLKAVERYDPSKGHISNILPSYIRGEILNVLRDRAHILKFPRILHWQDRIRPEYFSQPYGNLNSPDPVVLEDMIGELDFEFQHIDYELDLDILLQLCPERTQRIIRMYYLEDMSRRRIAEYEELSQMHVSRLIRQGMGIMKNTMTR